MPLSFPMPAAAPFVKGGVPPRQATGSKQALETPTEYEPQQVPANLGLASSIFNVRRRQRASNRLGGAAVCTHSVIIMYKMYRIVSRTDLTLQRSKHFGIQACGFKRSNTLTPSPTAFFKQQPFKRPGIQSLKNSYLKKPQPSPSSLVALGSSATNALRITPCVRHLA